jgi:epoxyqueuosine reductase
VEKLMILTSAQAKAIQLLAEELGFDASGLATSSDPDSPGEQRAASRFGEWIAAGRAGEMNYLKREDQQGAHLRGALRRALPWARSVLVCAVNYNTVAPRSTGPADKNAAWIARYAMSGGENGEPTDYHEVILARLRELEQRLHDEFGEFESRCYVDTGPIVERDYAKRAGLGWIGKNTCLLNQNLGSWLYLGVIVLGVELSTEAVAPNALDRCGSCKRCIEACPTNALDKPYEMDASRCISYLTIEKRGEIPEELRAGIGRNVFGCDICQDVCPWNRKAPAGLWPQLQSRPDLINPALDWLASLDKDGFKRVFRRSPVERTKLKGLRRNVAIAMGNSREAKYVPSLESWLDDEDEAVRDSAAWAIARIVTNE